MGAAEVSLVLTTGRVNTVRFINQFMAGYGNYTQERGLLVGKSALHEQG
jgi:hypothetical protein